uniref:LON2 n=1 Tax=Arundo donax TaxID=35708 RepID=A0A0A9CXZ4_ARUDO
MAEDDLPSASPSATAASSTFASASTAAASESLAEELEQNRALLPSIIELRPPLSAPRTLRSGDLSSSAAATAGAAANRAGKTAAEATAARSMGYIEDYAE